MVSLTPWRRQQHSIGFSPLSHFLPLFVLYCSIHVVVTKCRLGKLEGGTAYLGSQLQWIQSITWARQGNVPVGTFGHWLLFLSLVACVTVLPLEACVTVLIPSSLCYGIGSTSQRLTFFFKEYS